jgi:arylsulfatase A-like enzyme
MRVTANSFIAALCLIASTPLVAAERPNIVFIMSDDHAVKAVSAYGNAIMQTPNIDRLAREGMRFDRAYVGNAICGPSRATMLTGMHSHGNGFYSNEWSGPFDGNQQTLSKLLKAGGYQTAVVGKWHLYSDPVGFDHWEVITNAFEQGTYFLPHFRSPAGVEEATGYVANLVTDKAINWLRQAKEMAMADYVERGPRQGRKLFPDASLDDWAGCGQLRDTFQPASMYVPRQSTQYNLALGFDASGTPKRTRFRAVPSLTA